MRCGQNSQNTLCRIRPIGGFLEESSSISGDLVALKVVAVRIYVVVKMTSEDATYCKPMVVPMSDMHEGKTLEEDTCMA